MTAPAISGAAETVRPDEVGVDACPTESRATRLTRLTRLTRIAAAVALVPDPELAGVAIGSLGLVRSVAVDDEGVAKVVVATTFLGCPALDMMRSDVAAAAVGAGALRADVAFALSPPWTTDAITAQGRAALAALGIAVPIGGEVVCPFCSSRAMLRPLAAVGPASCRSLRWCDSCRNVVEVMRNPDAESSFVATLPSPTRRQSYAHV